MENSLAYVVERRIERTMEALKRNRMEAYYARDRAQALEKTFELLPRGATVTHGGSMTLSECGIAEALRERRGEYTYLDRGAPGLTPEQVGELYRRSFFADCYLGSANAVTQEGEILNVDGNGNRVAAYLYGPRKVLLVVGCNKIVPNLAAAFERIKQTAAPANARRLSCATPCATSGICSDCHGPGRICCDYVVQGFQREEGRIQVILVGEALGY